MNSQFKFFLYLLLLSPLVAYLSYNVGFNEYRYLLRPIFWVVALLWFLRRNQSIGFPPYLWYLVCYIIYKSFWDCYNFYYEGMPLLDIIKKPHIDTLFILIIISNTNIDQSFIKNSFKIIKITIVVAFVFTLIQLFIDPTFFYHNSFEETNDSSIYQVRRSSVFSYVDENSLGFDFLPLFAVFLGYSLFSKSKVGLLVLAAAIISFGSNTRYIMVGYVIVLLQFLIYSKFNVVKIIKYAFFVLIAGICLLMFLQWAGYDLNTYVLERLFPEQDITKSTRYFAYEIFTQFFYENWLLGTGQHLTNQIKNALDGYSSQIHVGYLSHLVSYGIVGSFFLFMFWIKLAQKLFQDARFTSYYGSFFAFLVFLWSNATLVYYSIFTYGLIISFVYSKYLIEQKRLQLINLRPNAEY